MNILVTCPPMLKQMSALEAEFKSRGWKATTPDVVQTLSIEQLCELLPEHDGWIIGDDPANATVVAAAATGKLRAAIKWGVGTDNVDFSAFEQHGITVTHTPGMFGDEVADIALGYVIALARHTFEIHAGVVSGNWPKPTGTSLAGKTAGLVGYGDIGQQLSKRLRACGMNLVVYDPAYAGKNSEDQRITHRSWPEDLESCDFICFTCALNEHNHHMLNDQTLAHTKPGLRIINVARGPLIDEQALLKGLEAGSIGAVALDVFENEPLALDNRLRSYPQNVFGSHNASNTLDAVMKTSYTAIKLLEEQLK